MSVVKPKSKQLLWSITTDDGSSINQSEFEVIICNRRQAWENERVQLAIGFGFASHWLRKRPKFCQPITEWSKANYRSKRELPPTLNWKPLYNRLFPIISGEVHETFEKRDLHHKGLGPVEPLVDKERDSDVKAFGDGL